MKYLLFCLQLIALNLHAQNVGIGNTAPAEKPDVSGNIAVSGELRPNGTAGQAGDVLTNSGAGTMSWANAGSFKNMVSFTDTSTRTFTGTCLQVSLKFGLNAEAAAAQGWKRVVAVAAT